MSRIEICIVRSGTSAVHNMQKVPSDLFDICHLLLLTKHLEVADIKVYLSLFAALWQCKASFTRYM